MIIKVTVEPGLGVITLADDDGYQRIEPLIGPAPLAEIDPYVLLHTPRITSYPDMPPDLPCEIAWWPK